MPGHASVDGVALITGGAAGIGKETALAFAEAGARGVVVADINHDGALSVAEECQKFSKHRQFRAIAVKVDIVDEDSVESMVQSANEAFGRIDYSIHSAGIGNLSGATTPNLKVDVFSKTLETNVKGTMLCVRAVSKAMAGQEPLRFEGRHGSRSLGRGSIINLGSVASYCAAPGMMPYTVSKHAVIGLTKTAAIDNVGNHIRVNAVCPSWVDTPMMQASLKRIPPLGAIIKAASPLGRAAEVEEVADYIVFLCSPSASYINGTGLVIDAGLTLTPTRLIPAATGPSINDLLNTPNASTSSGDGVDSELGAPSPHPVQEQTTPYLDLVNMELLHHWSTVIYATMSPESAQQGTWQITAVKVGLCHPFLLYEILAIAAMHLAICKPERRDFYHMRATELQSVALNGFNTVQKQVDRSNCVAILLFSSLLGVHLLANRADTSGLDSSEYLGHIQSYISLTRSVHSLVIAEFWSYLHESEIQPLTKLSARGPQPPYNNIPSECRGLFDLLDEAQLPPPSIKAYNTAIDRSFWLFDIADTPSTRHSTIRWIIAWPVQFPEEFVVLLNQRRPEALIILAYYGVFLHSYHNAWAIGDFGAALVKAISAQLGNYWSRWLLWPNRMVDCG